MQQKMPAQAPATRVAVIGGSAADGCRQLTLVGEEGSLTLTESAAVDLIVRMVTELDGTPELLQVLAAAAPATSPG